MPSRAPRASSWSSTIRISRTSPNVISSPAMRALVGCTVLLALAVALAVPGAAPGAEPTLHLVLTPSQKPTDLLAAGDEFGRVLGRLVGMPVRVPVPSDYAAVIEALRNRTADLAFVHPGGYVLAHREAKAKIGRASCRERGWVSGRAGARTERRR